MCGICGALGFEGGPAIALQMNNAMLHRGPDSAGFLHRPACSLAMRRLKIIDLSTGDQPLFNEDGRVAVFLNGEIYNYARLRSELQAAGHRFATRSDTEVIAHAYETWGVGCLGRLRGMFALALLDERQAGETRLLLARDRLGIKPLYVWQQGDLLLFASEVRALLASGQVPREISPAGLYTYLAFGSVQEPLALVEGITSLPPASWLLASGMGGSLHLERGVYWRPPEPNDHQPGPGEVRLWLEDAISSHLVADVPLGAFLSGGLDSGSIVALGSRALAHPMRSFTLAFDNWPDDERALAGQTAQMSGAEHTVQVIRQEELLDDLPAALAAMDQPTVDGVNSWFVSRAARRAGLTVALSGVGGDELFAGYPAFTSVPPLKRLPHAMPWLRFLPLERALSILGQGAPDGRRKLAAYLLGDLPLHHSYYAVRGLFTGAQIETLIKPERRSRLGEDGRGMETWHHAAAGELSTAARYDPVGEVSWLELSQYMRSTLLRDTDMMSMAHSLEVRVPLVDHLLVERVLPLAGGMKVQRGKVKPLLAGALQGCLPPAVLSSPKRTFTFPFEQWLRQGLRQKVQHSLLDLAGKTDGLLQPAAAARVWEQYAAGLTNWAHPWALYVLGEWLEYLL